MGNSIVALTLVLFINLLMILSQLSVAGLDEDAPYVYNKNGTLIESFEKDGVIVDSTDSEITSNYPEVALIEPSSGNPFTDLVSSIKSWFSNTLGLKYVKAILFSPYLILKGIMPEYQSVALTLGLFWYAITFFVIISFMWGKE